MTFEGKYRGHAHPHEQPLCVTGPLMILAIPSIILGFWGSPFTNYKLQHYLDHHFHSHMEQGQSAMEFVMHEMSLPFGYIPFTMFLVGTIAAYLIYVQQIKIGDKTVNEWFKSSFGIVYSGSSNKWWIDEIYDVIVAGFMFLFRFTWKAFEVIIIEGFIINGICWRGTEFVGEVLKVQQSGKLQNYVLVMISAAMLMVAWFIYN